MAKVHEMRDEYAWLLEQMPQGRPVPQQVRDIRWMIEELRVSYFAHARGTAVPGVGQADREGDRRGGAVTAPAHRVSSTRRLLLLYSPSRSATQESAANQGPVEQFGVLATLSRWRPRVQIPSGPRLRKPRPEQSARGFFARRPHHRTTRQPAKVEAAPAAQPQSDTANPVRTAHPKPRPEPPARGFSARRPHHRTTRQPAKVEAAPAAQPQTDTANPVRTAHPKPRPEQSARGFSARRPHHRTTRHP